MYSLLLSSMDFVVLELYSAISFSDGCFVKTDILFVLSIRKLVTSNFEILICKMIVTLTEKNDIVRYI